MICDVKQDVIQEKGFGGLLELSCHELNSSLFSWLLHKTNIAYYQLELLGKKTIPLTSYDVGIVMGIPHNETNLVLVEPNAKRSWVLVLNYTKRLMCMIDDMY